MPTDRLDTLKALLQEKPKDSFLLFAIAKEYESQGMADEALNHYLMIYENDPEYVGLYYHLGKLYEAIREDLVALKIYQEGIEIAKKQGDFHALSELNNVKMNLELLLGN